MSKTKLEVSIAHDDSAEDMTTNQVIAHTSHRNPFVPKNISTQFMQDPSTVSDYTIEPSFPMSNPGGYSFDGSDRAETQTQTQWYGNSLADPLPLSALSQWQSPSTSVSDRVTLTGPLHQSLPWGSTAQFSTDSAHKVQNFAFDMTPLFSGPSSAVCTNTLPYVETSIPAPHQIAFGSMIASVYRQDNSSGYVFQCNNAGCGGATFNRWHDFERHDNAYHNGTSVLWCPVQGCNRSKAPGNKYFPKVRKDKLREHVRNMHGVNYDG